MNNVSTQYPIRKVQLSLTDYESVSTSFRPLRAAIVDNNRQSLPRRRDFDIVANIQSICIYANDIQFTYLKFGIIPRDRCRQRQLLIAC